MKKFLIPIAVLTLMFAPLQVAQMQTAPPMLDKLKTAGNEAQYDTSGEKGNLPQKVGAIVKIFLTILGIIAILFVLYAGFKWMTAAGNEDQVTEAKNTLKNGLAGLFIILLAYSITAFVITKFGGATGTEFDLGAETAEPGT